MKTLQNGTFFEYRTKEEINGWPLVHINIGTNPETGRFRVARGVVAIGNIAYGIVSIGVAAFGIVTCAAFGLGVVSLASLAVGIIAVGAVSLGYEYALGAVVQSANSAIGVVGLEFPLAVWSLIVATLIALVIWGQQKVRAR